MNFDITKRTYYITLHGSHAYGMSRPESDIDLKGIAIPPREYFLGFQKNFEQFEGNYPFEASVKSRLEGLVKRSIPANEKMDSCIYDIRKFFHLASLCNPNIIEVLFTDEGTHLLRNKLLEPLFENRNLFLSTKANFSFRGYGFSQLKRINLHRRWLLNPPTKKPERKDFDLPERTLVPADQLLAAESMIAKRVGEWMFEQDEMSPELLNSVRSKTIESFVDVFNGLGITDIVKDGKLDTNTLSNAAGRLLGFSDNFLVLLEKERRYKSSMNEYRSYEKWKAERNPKRAAMEAESGFDRKHASHLVRLMRCGEEIIRFGKVQVKRPDAEELLAIRNGAWTYDELVDWAEKKDKEIQEFYDSGKSPLPKRVDVEKLNSLCISIVEKVI